MKFETCDKFVKIKIFSHRILQNESAGWISICWRGLLLDGIMKTFGSLKWMKILKNSVVDVKKFNNVLILFWNGKIGIKIFIFPLSIFLHISFYISVTCWCLGTNGASDCWAYGIYFWESKRVSYHRINPYGLQPALHHPSLSLLILSCRGL